MPCAAGGPTLGSNLLLESLVGRDIVDSNSIVSKKLEAVMHRQKVALGTIYRQHSYTALLSVRTCGKLAV
jgi:hypothetical protein